MRVKKLLHTRMRVSDMEQTINFYTNILGLEVLERKVSPRGSYLAFLKVPNSEELIELTSFPPSGPVTVQEDLVHLAFQVENLDDTITSLNAQGVKITDGPTQSSSGSRFIFIDAPDGYEIELIERPPNVKIV
ncbi:MAG: VOC family protein [Nitrospirae bacterium]|nr:VOC family protein [Nitrospirota bacterium]